MTAKQDIFSYRINYYIKILLIIASIMVMNSDSYFIAGLVSIGILTLLLKGKVRNSWLKLVSRLAFVFIAYILLDLLFGNDIEATLTFVGKLLCYLLLLTWFKESTTLESYLSDVYSATFIFGFNYISKKVDSFNHYFNFYIISTMKLVSKFVESYDKLFKQRTSFINLFLQVFINTLMRIRETKSETNEEMSVINYRTFDWKANLPIMGLLIILGFLYWSNCEELCRSFLLK